MRRILVAWVLIAGLAWGYVDSSQVDFSFLVPAKPHGFLRVSPNGTFVWADGSRARFWGVNVSNRSLWISHDEIDRAVDALAKAGTNLVRFEALDSKGGVLEIPGHPGSRVMDPMKLDTVHYWIYRLSLRHIDYYLDLVDFREFTPEDGAEGPLNRGARPEAMFDTRLIALQEEYASQLLTTVNPYTKVAPVNDPHLALMEICNEHGFFLNPTTLPKMAEPYRSRLQALWNSFLAQRYPDRDTLAAAWKDDLGENEDPAAGTVQITYLPDSVGGMRDPATVGRRLADAIEFYYTVQRNYFHTMMGYLRSIGLRIPVTAVVSNDIAPDLASVAAECDFMAENFYADHPRFEGQDWEGKYHFRNTNQLRQEGALGFAPYTSALRWSHKPVVLREWGTVWPNQYRAVSIPEAVAYANLQDYDGLLLFCYKTGQYENRLIFFGYEADPTVWGLFGLGAEMFLRHDVRAADKNVTIVHTPQTLFDFPNGVTDAFRLAWLVRLTTDYQVDPSAAPMTVPAAPQTLPAVMQSLGWSPAAIDQIVQTGQYTSGTGQVTLDAHAGRLFVRTPSSCVIAGELEGDDALTAGSLSVLSDTPSGTVMAVALDGRPLEESHHYVVKMVTVAENQDQVFLRLTPPDQVPPDWVLQEEGKAPVHTLGTPSETGTEVLLGGTSVVSIGASNGTWELVVNGPRATFLCDTPGLPAIVLGHPLKTTGHPQSLPSR